MGKTGSNGAEHRGRRRYWSRLTLEQQAVIRPGDSLIMIMIADNGRDAGLELIKPPWKRKQSTASLAESNFKS
jgi:hypothetical protein